MKHAYLIIAHNEFPVLQQLISSLDDERNRIFIHIDRKVKKLPDLKTKHARLHVLQNRLRVEWGHHSQIYTELVMFEAALAHKDCSFFHLISGTHMPLYSQDYIHRFFSAYNDKQLLSPLDTDETEIEAKMMRYNFFVNQKVTSPKNGGMLSHYGWRFLRAVQRYLNVYRNRNYEYRKAANWLSLSRNAVTLLVSRKSEIKRKYRFSMCADEFFVPSELYNSELRNTMIFSDRLLKHEINTHAIVYRLEDVPKLIASECLYARKLSEQDWNAVLAVMDIATKRR